MGTAAVGGVPRGHLRGALARPGRPELPPELSRCRLATDHRLRGEGLPNRFATTTRFLPSRSVNGKGSSRPRNKDWLRYADPADLNKLRFALLDFIADFANWDNSTVPAYLETSRALTQAAHEALGGDARHAAAGR